MILNILVFDGFILIAKLFANSLRIFETCLTDIDNLFKKLVSLLPLPIKFIGSLKVTAPFFVVEFNFSIMSLIFHLILN